MTDATAELGESLRGCGSGIGITVDAQDAKLRARLKSA